MNIFEAVKQSVTTRQAAEMYGVNVRRNGMACCIFHEDKTPSMKVDNRFHCFGCGADGDVIDFAAQLYGCNKKQATEKLAADFGISYDCKSHSPPPSLKRQLTEKQQLCKAINTCYRVYCDYLHLLQDGTEEQKTQLVQMKEKNLPELKKKIEQYKDKTQGKEVRDAFESNSRNNRADFVA